MAEPSRDARMSFDRVAERYGEARPRYPGELFDELFRKLPGQPEILEVGPGTGQATVDLLGRGAVVTAVEIGPRMAAELQQRVSSSRLRIIVGDFEAVALPSGSYDAIFAATAYHWVGAPARLDLPARLLRNGGILAVIDLVQVDSPDDRGFFAAAQPIYERYGEGHRGPPLPARDRVVPPIFEALVADPRYADVVLHRQDWNQTMTAEQYRSLVRSYSTTQMLDPERRQRLLAALVAFIEERFEGRIVRPLVATLTLARLARPGAERQPRPVPVRTTPRTGAGRRGRCAARAACSGGSRIGGPAARRASS